MLRRNPKQLTYICVPFATLLGLIIAEPAHPTVWLGGLIYLVVYFVLVAMIPMLIAELIVRVIASKRMDSSVVAQRVWAAGLLFIPVFGFLGYVMGDVLTMADRGQSGSEFFPLYLILMALYTFWVIPLVGIIYALIKLRK